MYGNKGKNILICPLDWGIGHATRSEYIARALVQKGCNVFIAGTSVILDSISNNLPARRILFRSIKVRYSKFLPQYIVVLFQLPFLMLQAFSDHFNIRRFIRRYQIDIVISDNRFGLWSNKAYTVYITHQLRIKLSRRLRFMELFLSFIHNWVIGKYNECWIPDLPGEPNLAGELSHPSQLPENSSYIGLLSKLQGIQTLSQKELIERSFITLILSGPEPQRSVLEDKITGLPALAGKLLVVVAGQPVMHGNSETRNYHVRYSYPDPAILKWLIEESELVICRSGYSTLMDLSLIGKSALLVPTPGQTEQEYLAGYLEGKGWYKVLRQDKIDDITDLMSMKVSSIPQMRELSEILFEKAISRLLGEEKGYKERKKSKYKT